MQNSIKTRGNLCTELGSPVLVDVLYRCLEVFLLSRTQDRNDRSNGGWWAINIEMHYENDTGCRYYSKGNLHSYNYKFRGQCQ